MEIEEIVSKNIRRFRERENLTQEQLSEKCRSSKNYISQLEQQNRFPSVTMLKKLSASLNVQIFEFFIDDKSYEIKRKRDRIQKEIMKSLEDKLSEHMERLNVL